MLEHGVEDDQQLAHTSDEGHLLGLAGREQPLIEVPYDGVVAAGYQRPHVEGAAHSGTSAPDTPFAPQGAAVTVEGSHPHQGGDLPAFQSAQLRQYARRLRESCSPTPGTVRNRSSFSRHTGLSRRVCLRAWSRSSISCSSQAIWASMRGRTARMAVAGGSSRRPAWSSLVSAGGQGVECLGLGVSQRAHGGTNGLSEVGQDRRVESIGLGQPSWPWQSPVPDGGWPRPQATTQLPRRRTMATPGDSSSTRSGPTLSIWETRACSHY